jgi:hypothetical protein
VKKLPYTATTRTGDVLDIEFPLHNDTVDPVRVGQLVSTLLRAIDRDFDVAGEMSNGDVLQALAMATAIRARMIHAPSQLTEGIAKELLSISLDAVANAEHRGAEAGQA